MSASSRKFLCRVAVTAACLLAPIAAHAYVECTVTPERYYVGDDGVLWVIWKQGGAGIIWQTDPDFKPTLAAVLAALLANRTMTVRYADGSACTGWPVPIGGIWLNGGTQ